MHDDEFHAYKMKKIYLVKSLINEVEEAQKKATDLLQKGAVQDLEENEKQSEAGKDDIVAVKGKNVTKVILPKNTGGYIIGKKLNTLYSIANMTSSSMAVTDDLVLDLTGKDENIDNAITAIKSLMVYQENIEDKLNTIQLVNLESGKNLYIIVKVFEPQSVSDPIFILRGNASDDHHGAIYDRFMEEIKDSRLESICLGGGRLLHDKCKRTIQVFEYPQGYGKADEQLTCQILRTNYPDYKIDFIEN